MKKRILTIVLALVMVFSMVPAASLTAFAATSANIGSSAYCTVNINQSLINKRGTQYASVKIKTYDGTGWWNTRAKVRITLRDGNGRYITSWIARGGDTIRLGDNHRSYRICVSLYDNPGNSIFSQGKNFVNIGSCKWTISNAKKCTIR